jgi:hypothetical protein
MRRLLECLVTAAVACAAGSCGEDDADEVITEPVARLDGAWVGSTDQNLPMEFLVENNGVVLWVVGYRAAGTACTDDFPIIVFNRQLPYGPFAITGGVLTLAVSGNRGAMSATGEFSDDGNADGTMTVNATVCNATLNTAWTATRTTSASANVTGTWPGFIKSNLLDETASSLTFAQSGTSLSGSYTTGTGTGGTISGRIEGRLITFTLTQITASCPGTFTGYGAVLSNPQSIVLFFRGTDCFGAHTGGEARGTR